LQPLHSLQIFDQNFVSFTEQRQLTRLLDTASKFALFSVSGLKDEKLIQKQTYIKTETCKLYSRSFWIFLPNIIKIDPYNFELYRFKFGPFFETQCRREEASDMLQQEQGDLGRVWQECPAVTDKPARRETMPKIAPVEI